MGKRLTVGKILLSFLLFFTIWTLRIALFKPMIEAAFVLWAREAADSVIKLTIWMGFGFFMIRRHDDDLNANLYEMFKTPVKGWIFFPILLLFIAYHIVGMLLLHGGPYLNPNFHPSRLISQFLLVGILEETVFRGWFYNSLSCCCPRWAANALSSLMFTLIHLPGWIVGGTSIQVILATCPGIFILSLLFGWTFQKNRSLRTPILLHMLWDIMNITMV